MKYVAAYTLLALRGESNIDAAKVKALLEACECEVNQDSLDAVVNALKGKDLSELINNGLSKVSSLSVGGGGSSGGAGAGGAGGAEEKKEEEAEEEEEVEEEEVDFDMGDLFG